MEVTEILITPHTVMEIHRQKAHIGTHALYKWFTQRNLKVTWQEIKRVARMHHM